MNRRQFIGAACGAALSGKLSAAGPGCSTEYPDIRSIPLDLSPPPILSAMPGPGRRVRRTLETYRGTDVYHTLYLPTDWQPGKRYPILVEYPGNGPFTSSCGDYSSGDVDGCNLGFGISAGQRFIWIGLPCINTSHTGNQLWWWGDVRATVSYCREAVTDACNRFGGDRHAVILSGFSRGAIACNFIGLYDDSISDLWLGFIAYSHYDGVEKWNYEGGDLAAARKRLSRLTGRATFVAQEISTGNIEAYIRDSGVKDPFTFQAIPFHNHNNTWVLRDIPERRALRAWVDDLLIRRPGAARMRG